MGHETTFDVQSGHQLSQIIFKFSLSLQPFTNTKHEWCLPQFEEIEVSSMPNLFSIQ